MLKALIFDVDGTLANTEEYHRQAFNDIFKQLGLAWYWSVSLYTQLLEVTGGKERLKYYIEQYLPDFKPSNDINQFIQDLHSLKTDRYNQLLTQGSMELRPGVERLILDARENQQFLAIATTTSSKNVIELIKMTLGEKALSWFKVIVSGEMVTAKKPAPDVYALVLAQLALPAEQCIAIEDSYPGLQSALAAGIKTIITPSNYTQHQNFTGASLVVDSLGEPNQPFKVIGGNAYGYDYLTIPFLHKISQGKE